MKPQVKLLAGYHLTAAERRHIPLAIEELRRMFESAIEAVPEIVPAYERTQIRVGPRKLYTVKPDSKNPAHYYVTIRQAEANSYGVLHWRERVVHIETKGISPLYLPNCKGREDMGARGYRCELTPEGEQAVIPGCERNASPKARQLDLFG